MIIPTKRAGTRRGLKLDPEWLSEPTESADTEGPSAPGLLFFCRERWRSRKKQAVFCENQDSGRRRGRRRGPWATQEEELSQEVRKHPQGTLPWPWSCCALCRLQTRAERILSPLTPVLPGLRPGESELHQHLPEACWAGSGTPTCTAPMASCQVGTGEPEAGSVTRKGNGLYVNYGTAYTPDSG